MGSLLSAEKTPKYGGFNGVINNQLTERLAQVNTGNQINGINENQPRIIFNEESLILPNNIEGNSDMDFVKSCLKNHKRLNLLFRASQHQFSAAKFHILCDGVPNLLVLAKTEYGKVVGGFNSIGWKNSDGQYAADPKKISFIFSVALRQKMDLIKPQYAITNNLSWGPCFGDDIQIRDKCNTDRNSYLIFPSHYNFTSKPYNQNQQTFKLFSGSPNFMVGIAEYEVFSLAE